MFSGKYTHINNVIEQIYRNYGFEVSRDDAMEFVWEVIGIMGRPEILTTNVMDVIVDDYKGLLPADLYLFIGCREKVTKTPLRLNTNIYGVNKNNSINYTEIIEKTINKIEDNGVLIDDIQNAYFSIGISIQDYFSKDYVDSYVYQISNSIIFTGLKKAVLEVAYLGFPVWKDNTPMIPEDPKIIRNIVDYIAEKVAFKLMLTDNLSERKWKFIEEKSTWSMGSAINYLKTPSLDLMQELKNNHLRLMPKANLWEEGF